jgi:hypothetical protein
VEIVSNIINKYFGKKILKGKQSQRKVALISLITSGKYAGINKRYNEIARSIPAMYRV